MGNKSSISVFAYFIMDGISTPMNKVFPLGVDRILEGLSFPDQTSSFVYMKPHCPIGFKETHIYRHYYEELELQMEKKKKVHDKIFQQNNVNHK